MSRQWFVYARVAIPVLLCVAGIVTLATRARATGVVSKADLQGPWQIALVSGGGGCGVGTALVNLTLNASGSSSNAVMVGHTAGCGDSTLTGQSFTITSLNSNGSGTAGLSCGAGCGFTFAIQVAPDRSTFNLVDITDPGNFLGGMAVHQ